MTHQRRPSNTAPARTRRFLAGTSLSIGSKLFILVVTLIALASAIFIGVQVRQERARLWAAKTQDAQTDVGVISLAWAKWVTERNQNVAAFKMKMVRKRHDLAAMRVWSGPEQVLAAMDREPGKFPQKSPPWQLEETFKQITWDFIEVSHPIYAPGSKKRVGTLQMYLSTGELKDSYYSFIVSNILLSVFMQFMLGLVVFLLARYFVSQPLAALSEGVDQLRAGRMIDIDVDSHDEIGVLAKTFREMAATVREREEEIQQRNEDLSLVLEHVGQGYILLDHTGRMAGEHSKIVEKWLGVPRKGELFWEFIRDFDGRRSDWFEACWTAMGEGLLTNGIYLDQLPPRIGSDMLALDIEYRHVEANGDLERVILLLSDVTDLITAERNELELRESKVLLDSLVRNRNEFFGFFEEANSLVNRVALQNESEEVIRRDLHTLKGLAASIGLASFSEFCHQVEDRFWAENVVRMEDRADLCRRWANISRAVAGYINLHGNISVSVAHYERVVKLVEDGAETKVILHEMTKWRQEATKDRFERMGRQAKTLAQETGKGHLEVLIEDHGVYLPATIYRDFWSTLTHVVRNAIGHGLESVKERTAADKCEAEIVFRSFEDTNDLIIEVADNGRGIDWEKIKDVARRKGLPADTDEQLIDALFADGVSSSDNVDELSGRGVGMAAVKAATESLGGRIEVYSQPQRGTSFQFVFPRDEKFQEKNLAA